MNLDLGGKLEPEYRDLKNVIPNSMLSDGVFDVLRRSLIFGDGEIKLKNNPTFNFIETEEIRFNFKPYYLKSTVGTPCAITRAKQYPNATEYLDIISNKDIKIRKKTRENIRSFLNKYESRMEIKRLNKNNYEEYLDEVLQIYKEASAYVDMSKKSDRIELKYLKTEPDDNDYFYVIFIDGIMHGFYNDYQINDKVFVSDDFKLLRNHKKTGENLHGFAETMYLYEIKNGPSYWNNLGISNGMKPTLINFKKKFALGYQIYYFHRSLLHKKYEPNGNLDRWFT